MRVVVLSSTRWRAPWLSKQHLAVALRAHGDEVLYVDPPLSPLSPIRQPDRVADVLGRDGGEQGVGVWTPVVLPAQNSRLVQRVNATIIDRGVRRRLGPSEIALAFGLESRSSLRRMSGCRIYHCTDSWVDHPGNDPRLARRREDEMVETADVVTACSQPLVEMLAERGVHARFVPHGVDAVPFVGVEPDPDLLALPGPRIGYAGGLNFRLSPAHLEAAIDAVAGGTLVLVGSSWRSARGDADPAIDELLRRPDVVAVGHRDGDSFASALTALDVGLVPYRPTPFNVRSFPLKVLQYLAAGLPVVSTTNGAAMEHPAHVTMHDEPDAFGAAVARWSADPGDPLERQHLALSRPWTRVAGELRDLAGAARP